MKDLNLEITEMIELYQRQLLSYAFRILNDSHRAQDVVQEVFIRYVQVRTDNLYTVKNVKSWLYRVLHNLVINIVKKERLPEMLKTDYKEQCHSSERQPDVLCEIRDGSENVLKLLVELKNLEQQVVMMKVMEQCSYKEISELLNVSVNYVGVTLRNALIKLRKLYQMELMTVNVLDVEVKS